MCFPPELMILINGLSKLKKASYMMRKVSFVGTALFSLIASAALLSSCGQQTQTPTSPEATSPTPNAVSPVASSATTSEASPVANSSANTASTAAESTANSAASTVAASPSTDATTTSTTSSETPVATSPSATTTDAPEFISAAAFEEIDTNKAGKIAAEDFVSYYAEKADAAKKLSKEDAEKKFKQLDKDSDGSLTKQEATGQM